MWLNVPIIRFAQILLAFIALIASNTYSAECNSAIYLGAVGHNNLDKVNRCLEQGVDVDSRGNRNQTALLIATHANHIGIAERLIAAGADTNARDDIEDSPFLYAGAEGRLEILRLTVAAGADLSSVNRYGGTALIPAAHHGHLEAVRYLLTTNIDIDHVNDLGWTALLEAVILGDGTEVYQSIVELLLENGADPGIADSDGVTPLVHAKRKGQTGIAQLIRKFVR